MDKCVQGRQQGQVGHEADFLKRAVRCALRMRALSGVMTVAMMNYQLFGAYVPKCSIEFRMHIRENKING